MQSSTIFIAGCATALDVSFMLSIVYGPIDHDDADKRQVVCPILVIIEVEVEVGFSVEHLLGSSCTNIANEILKFTL